MEDKKNLEFLRHSAAHLLAHAVLELFPKTQLTIGPTTEIGFFYDFLPEKNFKENDLQAIEKKMREIVEQDLPITQEELSKDQAKTLFKSNLFKLELIDEIKDQMVGISRQGDFYDLCRGGHVKSTGIIQYFKLLNISGSYWRADKSKQALQRISGTAFLTEKDFKSYEKRIKEAQIYDHRRLGKQLDLFSFHDEGIGFPFFHPNGKKIINVITNFIRKKLDQERYQEISTPIMLSDELWKRSGHYAHYKQNMYFSTIDDKIYAVKPMNCPGSILVYKNRPRSFRELPLKLSEFGIVHRHELSGVLHGLFRVRAFTQDDAHVFCTPEQIEEEVLKLVNLVNFVLEKFEFTKINVYFSTKPENAMGSNKIWEKAETALEKALKKSGIKFTVNSGDGAFYGPKIDFSIQDSMGREWQCSTIQLDFINPENFDLTYVASGGEKKRTVMIHRTIFGSFERFFGILLEHYKGKLPFWLAPLQAKILTITDDQNTYSEALLRILKSYDIRAEIDISNDQISAKVKNAQLEQIPWMLIIGKKEVESNTITLRHRDEKQEFGLTIEKLLEKVQQ